MKFFIIALIILIAVNCLADDFSTPDKPLHIVVSAAITYSAYKVYADYLHFKKEYAMIAGAFTSFTIGLIKESIDNEFFKKDMAANALGIMG